MRLLMASCQEVRRAGDHTAALEALQALEWEVAGAVAGTYRALLNPENGPLAQSVVRGGCSERGVLQLLLDVRLVRDTLAGGRPLTVIARGGSAGGAAGAVAGVAGVGGAAVAAAAALPDPATMAAVAERKKEMVALEQMLQVCTVCVCGGGGGGCGDGGVVVKMRITHGGWPKMARQLSVVSVGVFKWCWVLLPAFFVQNITSHFHHHFKPLPPPVQPLILLPICATCTTARTSCALHPPAPLSLPPALPPHILTSVPLARTGPSGPH
jgi:hypothetical protein